jgi:hypothetical protein
MLIFQGITHIILDEVHEREQNTDYLLIILREALKQRADLKIILMSATIEGNRDMFENYFSRLVILWFYIKVCVAMVWLRVNFAQNKITGIMAVISRN